MQTCEVSERETPRLSWVGILGTNSVRGQEVKKKRAEGQAFGSRFLPLEGV